MSEREQTDMTGVVETKLDALKESVDEFKGDVKSQLVDIKGSVDGLRNESPIHRIETLEKWRDEVKRTQNKLFVGLFLAFATAMTGVILTWLFNR